MKRFATLTVIFGLSSLAHLSAQGVPLLWCDEVQKSCDKYESPSEANLR